MLLQRLLVRDFRNLAHIELQPDPGFNIICGPNGHGKTNLLEAIHFLSTLRSFRAFRNRELLRDDDASIDEALIEGDVDRRGMRRTLKVIVSPRSRRIRVNDSTVSRLSDFFGSLNTVIFTPDDVGILRGSPAGRRLLLDRFIFNAAPAWADEVAAFDNALRQRNALLKNDRPDRTLVRAFDGEVARHGALVHARRHHWLQRLREPVQEAFRGIFDPDRTVDLAYSPGTPLPENVDPADHNAVEQTLLESFDDAWPRDLARGFTTIGPHRDDFEATIDGQPVRTHASQGQNRAFILAFRLAEIRLLTDEHDHPPILLLDDVTSEFDALRNERFFDVLRARQGQVFITTTDPAWVPLDGPAARWHITHGELTGNAAERNEP